MADPGLIQEFQLLFLAGHCCRLAASFQSGRSGTEWESVWEYAWERTLSGTLMRKGKRDQLQNGHGIRSRTVSMSVNGNAIGAE